MIHQKHIQFAMQASGKTLLHLQVEKFRNLGVIFASDGRRNKEIDAQKVKQTQFCVSFIALWWQNGCFQIQQTCQYLNRSSFRPSLMVMYLGND